MLGMDEELSTGPVKATALAHAGSPLPVTVLGRVWDTAAGPSTPWAHTGHTPGCCSLHQASVPARTGDQTLHWAPIRAHSRALGTTLGTHMGT